MLLASTTAPSPLGIDVSKATLDVVLLQQKTSHVARFPNTPEGFAALLSWLAQHGVQQVHAWMASYGQLLRCD